MPGPTPTPAPGTAPAPTGAQSGLGNQFTQAAGILVPQTGGSTATSRYGLGDNAKDPVTIGGGFGPVELDSNATAEDVMKWFATLPAGDPRLAQIQSWLLKAHLYPPGTSPSEVDFGVLGPKDLTAMAEAVRTAARTGADLSDYLQRSAAFGVYQGVAATVASKHATSGGTAGSVLTLDVPDPKALGATIDTEYEQLTGRKPTASERAGFIVAFTNASKQLQIDNYKRANGLDTGTLGQEGPGAFSAAPPQMLPLYPNDANTNLISGGVNTQVNAVNQATNDAATARDQQFLSLANQPFGSGGVGQPANYGAGGAGVSGIATVNQQQNYNPTDWAKEYVNSHSGAEAGAHNVADTFDTFLNILRGK